MKFLAKGSPDLFILPFWEGPKEASDSSPYQDLCKAPLESGDFKGKPGEQLLLYDGKGKRFLLLGLGSVKKVTAETFRRAYAAAIKTAQGKGIPSIGILFPKGAALSKEKTALAIAEGLLLTNYAFLELKKDSLKDSSFSLVKEAIWFHAPDLKSLEEIQRVVASVSFTRDLVNGNADDITPSKLVEVAHTLGSKVHVSILDKKKLEAEKMGLILAVARASTHDPALIVASYKGAPESREHVVLVGKGVTYDTGGLSLKPTDNMLTMKADMAGAATVLGVIKAAADLGKKVNLTIVAPIVENAIGSKGYKPGDVYRSYSGKTVEVNNTDAEGRLILADALSYAIDRLKPTCIVDIATLTGNIVVALGEEMSGLFTGDEKLAKELLDASFETGELLWRMPLHEEYFESLKSDYGDLQNTGGREAGAIKAALFLREFVKDAAWAHIDCGGPAFINRTRHYNPTKATGYGVRLLLEFVEGRFS